MDGTTRGSAQARSVEAGRGISWWTEAWPLFMKNAGMWIVLALIMLVICMVLAFVPIVGGLALSVLAPVFFGGWMLAARKVEAGGALEAGDLFAGFKEKLTPLAVLGAVLLGVTIVIAIIAGVLGFGAALGMGAAGSRGSTGGAFAAFGVGMLIVLLMFVVSVGIGMAMWFAPALVVFRNLAPIEAIQASFAASLKNIVPFILFGIVYIVAAIVASIPFGLGWLVLIPVLCLTAYGSYKDVFGD